MKRLIATVTALLMLSGCSIFGSVQPESVNQSFYLAYALVQSSYDSIQIAIVGGQIKTQEQARKLKDPVDATKANLDTAKALFDAGDTFDEGVFDSTRTTLVAIQQALLALGADSGTPELSTAPVDRAGNPLGATP